MKVGDVVMFTDRGRYAQWFYGRIGVIEQLSKRSVDGRDHCRVRWITSPVEYHDRMTEYSDFPLDYFEIPTDENLH